MIAKDPNNPKIEQKIESLKNFGCLHLYHPDV